MDKPTADTLDIQFLEPNPLQPRGSINPDSIADLVESIKLHGILEPLVVAKTPAGYQIIAGERRWRAAKIAGLTHVPVIIKETTPQSRYRRHTGHRQPTTILEVVGEKPAKAAKPAKKAAVK